MVGYDNIDELKNTYQELTPQKWHEIEKEIVKNQVFKRGYSDEYEKEYIHKDGTVFPISIKVWLLYDKKKPIGMWGIVRDITERKIAEEALRNSEEIARTVLDTISDGVILQSASGEILTWNKGAEDTFGISAKDAVGKTSEGKAWPTIRSDGSPYLGYDHPSMKTLRTGQPCRNEIMGVCHPSGQVHWISINANPLYWENEAKPDAVVISFSDITALKNEKDQTEMFLDATTDGIWTWNFKTNKLFFSPKYYKMLGYKPGAFPADYEHWLELIHPDDRENALTVAEEFLRTKPDQYKNVFRLRTSDGDYRWIQAQARVVERDDNGEAVLMAGNHEDITERKMTEMALRESEDKFSKAFESAPLLMTITSIDDGRFLNVNDAFVSLTGYSRELVVDSTSAEIGFVESEDRNRMIEILKAEGHVSNLEVSVNRADGSKMVCLYSAEILDIRGQERLLSTAVDISDRKQAENQLREREAFLDTLLEAIPIPVFYKDFEGRYLGCNRAFESFFGSAKETIIGKSVFDINPPELGKIYHTKDRELLDSGGIQVYESQVQGADRVLHDVIFHKAIFTDAQKKVAGLIGAILDVSEAKRNQKERLEMESRLKQAQKIESIGTLAGGIAHDFNNILFPIIGMSEILIEDLPPDSPEQENAYEILKAGKRGSELVKQILAFSRQSEHELMPTRIQHILKEVLKLTRSTIPTYIEINQNIQTDYGLVIADPTQIHQVAMNIITNAYHAVENVAEGAINVQLGEKEVSGTESSEIHIRPGRYAVLSISDNGHGMPADIMEKIFDPYFTTKEQGKGTGLGLAVVYGIVKEHKGTIKVYSEVGKGTTFDIYLPLMDKPSITESLDQKDQNVTGTERILLVDDEEAIAKLEKQMLERLGYMVTSRLNSIEALEAFKARKDDFDLVITDMSMPNMTGDQLAKELISIRPDIPVIICTGYSERMDDKKVKEIGVKGLLMKPIVKAELAKMVRKVLDKAKR